MATKYKLSKKNVKMIATFRNYSMFGEDEDSSTLYDIFNDAYCTSNSGETYYDCSGNELIKSGEYSLSVRYDAHPEDTYDLLCEKLNKLPKSVYKKAKKFGKENMGDIKCFTNQFWFNLTADKSLVEERRESINSFASSVAKSIDNLDI